MKFTVKQQVEPQRISDLLTTAFEGGSNYWYVIAEYVYPPGKSSRDYPGPERRDQLPLDGGAVVIRSHQYDEVNGARQWRLDQAAIQRGLDVMGEKYPRHLVDFMNEHDDAETADVFLQCCLFGEIVYG